MLLASATVAVAGTLSFIGLIAPHIARRLVGPRHAVMLPAAAGIGTLILLVADAIGRGAHPPIELPAGMITAVIGVLYLLGALVSISVALAAALGIGITVMLMAALMGLVFLSSGTGHDEAVADPLEDYD